MNAGGYSSTHSHLETDDIMDVNFNTSVHNYACNDGTQVYFRPEISMHGLR